MALDSRASSQLISHKTVLPRLESLSGRAEERVSGTRRLSEDDPVKVSCLLLHLVRDNTLVACRQDLTQFLARQEATRQDVSYGEYHIRCQRDFKSA